MERVNRRTLDYKEWRYIHMYPTFIPVNPKEYDVGARHIYTSRVWWPPEAHESEDVHIRYLRLYVHREQCADVLPRGGPVRSLWCCLVSCIWHLASLIRVALRESSSGDAGYIAEFYAVNIHEQAPP